MWSVPPNAAGAAVLLALLVGCASCRLDMQGTGELSDGPLVDSSSPAPDHELADDSLALDAPQADAAQVDAAPPDVSVDVAAPDAALDASEDEAQLVDAKDEEDAAESDIVDGPAEMGADVIEAEAATPCAGAFVGGYCWYGSDPNASCTDACVSHGGCNLQGTRDFAGSGGTDANCVAVVNALGYGSYPHQSYSNNSLGCHFAWDSWTYWSTALETTCDAAAPGQANAVRMCACNE